MTMHQKNECVDSLDICPNRAVVGKKIPIWPLSCLRLLFPPNKIHYKINTTTFLYHGSLTFSTRAPLLPLPTQNPLDHVTGWCGPQKYVFWRPLSLGVNWSDPGSNSTTNHIFYAGLRQLHGPWCKQPLVFTNLLISMCHANGVSLMATQSL